MKRTSKALWQGDLKTGSGTISTESGAIQDFPYSFSTRFEKGAGTNPEELIAAAHAGCFSMALVAELEKSGLRPREIRTTATISLEKSDEGWSIEEIHLSTSGVTDTKDSGQFLLAANKAKDNCPISKLLKAKITLDVTGV